jgi:hypothetical protein
MNMNLSLKKTALGVLAALTLAMSLATPASAQCRGCWIGPGIAAGLIGGALVGSAVANSNRGYYEGGDCWVERRPVYDEYGNPIGRRRVRVCR